MREKLLVMFILFIFAAFAQAQEAETLEIEVKNFGFNVAGGEKNAAITLEAGKTYTLVFTNNDIMDHEVILGKTAIKGQNGLSENFESLLFTDVEVDAQSLGKVTDFVRSPLKIGETFSMTVTIPDTLKGEWELACFVAGHYEAGMKAPLIIK